MRFVSPKILNEPAISVIWNSVARVILLQFTFTLLKMKDEPTNLVS